MYYLYNSDYVYLRNLQRIWTYHDVYAGEREREYNYLCYYLSIRICIHISMLYQKLSVLLNKLPHKKMQMDANDTNA